MNIIDIIIILLLLLAGVNGMHKGFFKTLVTSVGWVLLFLIAFSLKGPIAEWLSMNFPFFTFWGAFKGVTIINIIVYQVIAFIFIYSILMIAYRLIVNITGLIEKLLNITIILGIPSKILGFLLGLIEGYVLIFAALFILSLPTFNVDIIHDSELRPKILESTPILGSMMSNTSHAIDDIYNLKGNFSSDSKKEEFNRESVDIMLKYNLINVEYVEKLSSSGKIKISDIDIILNKYR